MSDVFPTIRVEGMKKQKVPAGFCAYSFDFRARYIFGYIIKPGRCVHERCSAENVFFDTQTGEIYRKEKNGK